MSNLIVGNINGQHAQVWEAPDQGINTDDSPQFAGLNITGDIFGAAGNFSGNIGVVGSSQMSSGSKGIHINTDTQAELKLDCGTGTTNGFARLQFTEDGTDRWRVEYDSVDNHLEFTESGVAAHLTLDNTTGDATFSGDVTLGPTKKLYLDNGSNTYIYESSNDVMNFRTGGINRLILDEVGDATFTGNLGIGPTTPTSLAGGGDRILHISDTTSGNFPEIVLDGNRGTTEAAAGAIAVGNNGTGIARIIGQPDAASTTKGAWVFETHNGTNYQTALTLNSDQNATFSGDVKVSKSGAAIVDIEDTSGTASSRIQWRNGATYHQDRFDWSDDTFKRYAYGNPSPIWTMGLGGDTTFTERVDITTASSGGASAVGYANELVLENSVDAGLSLLTPDGNNGNIVFGSPSDSDAVRIRGGYNGGTPEYALYVGGEVQQEVVGGESSLFGKITLQPDSAGDSSLNIERSTSTDYANIHFREAGAPKYSLQMRGDLSGSNLAVRKDNTENVMVFTDNGRVEHLHPSLLKDTTAPTDNPAGGYLYASGGALYWRGSAGTVTNIAPA